MNTEQVVTAASLIEGGSVTIKIVTIGSILALLALFTLFTLTPLLQTQPVQSACPQSKMLQYQRLVNLPTNAGAGSAMAYSVDGKLIATGGNMFGVHVWETAGFTPIAIWEHNAQPETTVGSIAFSPDGGYLAVARSDQTATLYNTTTGKQVLSIKHAYDVRRVVFSADGTWFASAGWDGSIQAVDMRVSPLHVMWTLQPMVDDGTKLLVTDIAVSPDGKQVASLSQGSWGPSVLDVWDLATGHSTRLEQWGLAVYSNVLFSPDGRWLLAGTGNGTPIKVWDTTTWQVIAQMPTRGAFNRIAISADGRYMAYSEGVSDSGGLKANVRVWDTATWTLLNEFALDDVVWDVQFSPDARQIAVAVGQPQLQQDGRNLGLHEAQLRDAQTGALIVRLPQSEMDEVTSVQFNPDGCQLALGTLNGIAVWQVK